MPNTTASIRETAEADIIQQVTNEVQDTIRLWAPEDWSSEQCDEVEETVLAHTRTVVSALSTNELRSSAALYMHVYSAVAATINLIQESVGEAE